MKKISTILLAALLVACQSPSNAMIMDHNLFYDGLLMVELDGKFGYVNEKDEMKIAALYDQAQPFLEGSALVFSGSTYYLIDTSGKNLLSRQYDYLDRDPQTGFVFYRLGNKLGLLDNKGKKITDPLFDNIDTFSESLARYRSGSKHGFLNTKGEVVIPAVYDFIGRFNNGLARALINDKFGFIDSKGETVIPFVYDYAQDFDKSGNVIVELDGDVLLVSKKNEQIINGADDITSSGLIYAVEKDGAIKLYNADGSIFSSLTFDDVWGFADYFGNLEYLGVDSNVLFNKDGEIVHHAPYYDSGFVEIFVKRQKVVALVEYTETDSLVYYDGGYFSVEGMLGQYASNERLVVVRNGKYGIIGLDGTIKLNFLYDGIVILDDDFIVFSNGEMMGAMNNKYATVLEAKYDSMTPTFVYYSNYRFI